MKLSVLEIARACGGKLVLQGDKVSEETQVTCVAHDSREVKEGGVFIAVPGERVDGHKFIPQVFENGAALVITEQTPEEVEEKCGVSAGAWGSYVLVENSLQALKEIGEYYRSTLQIPVIGITGSVGKTSTKQFVAGVLAEKYCVYKTEGNYNNEIGVPLSLLRIREEHEVAVIEMGISDFGEMHRLSKMARPNICVITNIGQCHLENLKSREGILKAKTEIFDYMAPDGEICLNGEDDMLRTVQKKAHYFGFGGFPGQEVRASDIDNKGLFGSDAVMHIPGSDGAEECVFPVHIPLPGRHMVINAAAAACVANILGLSPEQIAAGLKKLKAVEGRTNLLQTKRYTLIDDCYNANPVSMKSALDLLGMADTYRVAILGDMFELGDGSDRMHAEVGEYAADSGADCILCVGENSRHMWDAAVRTAMKLQKQGQEIFYFENLDTLFNALREKRDEITPAGCTVLVKASHGMEFQRVLEFLQQN